MAFERSAECSTISTMKDWRAGMSKALTTPCSMLSPRTSAMLMWWVSVSTASVSDWSIAIVCVQTSTEWRLMRSTITPASGASRKVGICPTNPTVPSMSDDWVSR